jgi:hypothetical protein
VLSNEGLSVDVRAAKVRLVSRTKLVKVEILVLSVVECLLRALGTNRNVGKVFVDTLGEERVKVGCGRDGQQETMGGFSGSIVVSVLVGVGRGCYLARYVSSRTLLMCWGLQARQFKVHNR